MTCGQPRRRWGSSAAVGYTIERRSRSMRASGSRAARRKLLSQRRTKAKNKKGWEEEGEEGQNEEEGTTVWREWAHWHGGRDPETRLCEASPCKAQLSSAQKPEIKMKPNQLLPDSEHLKPALLHRPGGYDVCFRASLSPPFT